MSLTTVRPNRGARGTMIACASAVALATLVTACADKGFTPPAKAYSTKINLQLTAVASQQTGFGARFLFVAAGFDDPNNNGNGDGNGGLLGYKFLPLVVGSQQVTLSVDISRCLAVMSSAGKSSCPMLVGAALVADTVAFSVDTSDIFSNTFDTKVTGPFEVVPGRTPTIPPIDLSTTRFGAITWQQDEALRLGGVNTPSGITSITGVPGAGTAPPTLFSITQGPNFPATPPQGPFDLPNLPQLAIFENGSWRKVTATTAPPNNSGFNSVSAIATNEVYIGANSGLYRYDGTSISRLTAVTDTIFAVNARTTATGAKLVIAAGPSVAWIGNGTTFTRYSLPQSIRPDGGVCITGPTEAFAASFSGGGLVRFDGTNWISVPATQTQGKLQLECPSPGQAYVIANGVAMLRWNGTSWVTVTGQGLGVGRLTNWGVVSPTEIYAYADSGTTDRAFYKFDGTTWQQVGRTRFAQQNGGLFSSGRPWADPRGGAAYVGSPFGRVEKITPTSVSVLSYVPSLRDIVVTSPTSAFAVGWNLFLARWDGSKWTVDNPPAGTPTVRILQGVWSDGPGNAWAVGGGSTILRWSGSATSGAWTVVSDINKPVSVADNYNGVWGTGSDVWMAGDATILHCKSTGACATEASAGTGILYSVWGTSASNVFVVGANGRINRYNGTSWSSMASPTSRALVRVAGSGPNDAWALGDSVLLHFDGTAWTNVPMVGDLRAFQSKAPSQFLQNTFQLGVWVKAANEAYIGNDYGSIARWDGTEWRQVRNVYLGRRILGISGAPGGCALAVTEAVSPLLSSTLLRGIGPTGCFSAPMVGATNWP